MSAPVAYVKKVTASDRQLAATWRRRRDLNPCASCPTYSLSRGAPSPLGYFSMVNICCSILFCEVFGGGEEIRTLGPFRDH